MSDKISVPALAFHSNGRNLHIALHREPDKETLKSVSGILKTHARADGRLFVDVRDLNDMGSSAASSLQTILKESPLPPNSIYFKGPLGFNLASTGNRVLIVREKGQKAAGAPAEAASRFAKRHHKCHCGGKCGDKCCQVTGGPCCSERHNHQDKRNVA